MCGARPARLAMSTEAEQDALLADRHRGVSPVQERLRASFRELGGMTVSAHGPGIFEHSW